MIKKIFSICMFLLATLVLHAQTPDMRMKITVNGDNVEVKDTVGNVVVTLSGVLVLPSTAFSNIVFEPKPIDSLKAVQLVEGSKVKWATINFNAKDKFDVGEPLSWHELYGNNGDIVYKTWGEPYGEKWRTPTYEEVIEILNKCDWTWDEQNKGYWVYRDKEAYPNDYIFLPVTAYMNTELDQERGVGEGHYWTTDRYDSKMSKELFFSSSNSGEGKLIEATYLLAIRPVWGDFPVTVNIDNTPDPSNSSVTFQLTLIKDDNTTVSEYGVAYRPKASSTWEYATANSSRYVTITGLSANTQYTYTAYYRLSNGSDPILTGSVFEFTTLDYMLKLSLGTVKNPAYNTAEITLNIDTDAPDKVEYGVIYAKKDEWEVEANRKKIVGEDALVSGTNNPVVRLSRLEAETTYTFEAYASLGGVPQTIMSEFTTPQKSKYPIPEAVDLGLSVKWSSFNLGASSIAEKGDLIGWGDVTGNRKDNDFKNYAPEILNKSISGDPKYDIAAAELGDGWRMPTIKEIEELKSCTMIFSPRDSNEIGENLIIIKGKDDCANNSIIIPMSGYRYLNEIRSENQYAHIWSSEAGNVGAFSCRFAGNSNTVNLVSSECDKWLGMTVRPVYGKPTETETPDDSTPGKDLTMEIVPGSENNKVTGIIPQDAVDMGTTVKWARWNIGVTKPEGELGHYYSWGMTEPLESYDKNSYEEKVPQYAETSSIEGIVLPSKDDVATTLWGSSWRMPTGGEFMQMYNNCDVERKNIGGIEGYLLTSRTTHNSIFFAAGGIKQKIEQNTENLYVGELGRYWSSSIWEDELYPSRESTWATCLYLNLKEEYLTTGGIERFVGLLIRPVIPLKGEAREKRLIEMKKRGIRIEE